MSSKQVGPGRNFWCYGGTLILTWLGALSGCGDTVVNATSPMDGGAGNASSGGASSGGGTVGALTGGKTGSGGVGTGGNAGSAPGGTDTGGKAASTGGAGGSETGGAPAGTGGRGGTGGATGAGGSPPVSQTCTNPSHVLPMNPSNPQDGITLSGFYVDTDTWNAANYQVSQTMYICDYNNWYVVANMNNNTGDGAVKTYPNVHEDFNGAPQISSFTTISSSFAHTAPHVGIYEYAYDIWLNGIASSGSTEVMIWTDNYNQVPSGSSLETVTFDGESYKVYKSGSYIAFVETTNVTTGTVNLLSFFNHIIAKGWIPSTSSIGAIDYGIELVSTNGADATFQLNNFSLTTN
jgi:hypothetical protein